LPSNVIVSWVDYLILGIVVLSALIGLWRGFVREAFALLTWFAAFWVALTFFKPFAPFFEGHIGDASARRVVAFAILFIAVLVIGALLGKLIGMLVEKTGLSGTDRLIGILFGLARGVLLVAALVLLGSATVLPRTAWWHRSVLIPYAKPVAVWLRQALPAEVARDMSFK
jgi:membrane protein required for colicin V production